MGKAATDPQNVRALGREKWRGCSAMMERACKLTAMRPLVSDLRHTRSAHFARGDSNRFRALATSCWALSRRLRRSVTASEVQPAGAGAAMRSRQRRRSLELEQASWGRQAPRLRRQAVRGCRSAVPSFAAHPAATPNAAHRLAAAASQAALACRKQVLPAARQAAAAAACTSSRRQQQGAARMHRNAPPARRPIRSSSSSPSSSRGSKLRRRSRWPDTTMPCCCTRSPPP